MNALGRLRTRLDAGLDEVAGGSGSRVADTETVEATPLRLLDVDTVRRYVEALECRLDVVACHIDGEAVWLDGDMEASQASPARPERGRRLARFAELGNTRGWACIHCEVQP